jgi:beta-mannosidase
MVAAVQTFDLATGWRFRRTDEGDESWMPVEKVPSVVHLDLINNKKYVTRASHVIREFIIDRKLLEFPTRSWAQMSST